MNNEKKYEVVNLALIYENELLLGYKHRPGDNPMWIPLGGKRDPDEDDYHCLMRELSQETKGNPKKLIDNVLLFEAFIGHTPNRNTPFLVTVYVKRIEKILAPNSEILKIEPFSYNHILQESLVSETTKRIATALYEK